MSGYSMIVLICSTALSHVDCQPKTAVDVVRGPRTDNVMTCTFNAQTMIAGTNLMHGDSVYMKVMCAPTLSAEQWIAEIDARKAAVR
jgi:hypothetical protein